VKCHTLAHVLELHVEVKTEGEHMSHIFNKYMQLKSRTEKYIGVNSSCLKISKQHNISWLQRIEKKNGQQIGLIILLQLTDLGHARSNIQI